MQAFCSAKDESSTVSLVRIRQEKVRTMKKAETNSIKVVLVVP